METISYETLTVPQQKRIERFGVPRSADVHCHCLAGLDDGPRTWADAVSLCRRIVDDGITTTIATPHQLGRYHRSNSAAKIRQAVETLTGELAQEHIPLEVLPGADVRVDEQVLALLDAQEIMTLADRGEYLLLELPHELFIDPQPLFDGLARRGIRPILSHPERHRFLQRSVAIVDSWVSNGVVIQITAGSLLGDFGRSARASAWELVQRGLVGLVATDAHDTAQRIPRLSAAIEMLSAEVGVELARQVCLVNPLAVVEGRDL
jgi:protein-tyrosine phosphatase